MRRYLIIAILLAVLITVPLFIFKDQAKELVLKISGRRKEVPSMLRALPFQKKIEKKDEHALLLASLSPNEIYLGPVAVTPRGTLRGEYVSLSLVIEFRDPETARRFEEQKDLLSHLLIERASKWNYLDFYSPDGLKMIKEDILKTFRTKLGDEVQRVYLVDLKFGKQRRL